MANNTQTGKDPEDKDIATIGGATAHTMGTEYQMVSEPVKEVAQAMGEATAGEAATAPERADDGRDPEAYADKQTAGTTGGEMNDKPFDIQGAIGRQNIAQPEAGEQHTEKGT